MSWLLRKKPLSKGAEQSTTRQEIGCAVEKMSVNIARWLEREDRGTKIALGARKFALRKPHSLYIECQ
jgi:hypothetical protein